MNKYITLALILIVALVGGYFVINSYVTSNFNPADDTAMFTTKSDDAATTTSTTAVSENYMDYAPALLSRAETGKVVLFFKANWCPNCNALDKNIKANLENIPENVTILKVDYDTSSDLKSKYGVTYQHTMVQVDANGNELNKWVGGNTLDSILDKVL